MFSKGGATKSVFTYEMKKEKNEGRSKGRAGGENLDNQSWSLEGTAKSDSHGDRIALISPNLTPPLFVIGSFCYHNALLEQKG